MQNNKRFGSDSFYDLSSVSKKVNETTSINQNEPKESGLSKDRNCEPKNQNIIQKNETFESINQQIEFKGYN